MRPCLKNEIKTKGLNAWFKWQSTALGSIPSTERENKKTQNQNMP
jgi:hypothetical protein